MGSRVINNRSIIEKLCEILIIEEDDNKENETIEKIVKQTPILYKNRNIFEVYKLKRIESIDEITTEDKNIYCINREITDKEVIEISKKKNII